MSIETKVRAVELLYADLDREISQFRSHTKLNCVSGCGKCCTYSNVDASPLEFLPWAFHLFLIGKAEATLEELRQRVNPICLIYRPLSNVDAHSGSCGDYKYRGLICRLFGYGANRDKYGELRISTCKIIKEGQAENFEKAMEALKNGLYIPVFTDYYMRLNQIDFRLGNNILPVNKALKVAIEEVLHYYAYRPFPQGNSDSA